MFGVGLGGTENLTERKLCQISDRPSVLEQTQQVDPHVKLYKYDHIIATKHCRYVPRPVVGCGLDLIPSGILKTKQQYGSYPSTSLLIALGCNMFLFCCDHENNPRASHCA